MKEFVFIAAGVRFCNEDMFAVGLAFFGVSFKEIQDSLRAVGSVQRRGLF